MKSVKPGDRLEQILLVRDVELKGAEDAPFVVLVLGNSSGRIATAPFWREELDRVAGISRGDVVQVSGTVGHYRNRTQLKVGAIRPLDPADHDRHQLLPSAGDITPYWRDVDSWREAMRRPSLKAILALFFDDQDLRGQFGQCPASVNGHHAELGGLLRHSWEVAEIGRGICRTSGADWDLTLAGALLHDIGKLDAYSWDVIFEHTAAGSLLGHVVLGSLRLDRMVRQAAPPPCTMEELAMLQHLILSHHGKRELGAPVEPMTLEAEILHHADHASARSETMGQALQDEANFAGDSLVSARALWQLDGRRVFRGKSAWGL